MLDSFPKFITIVETKDNELSIEELSNPIRNVKEVKRLNKPEKREEKKKRKQIINGSKSL